MLDIDRYSEVPIYEQVISQIERGVLLGLYRGGDMLPSVRALSQELSVNPNTLQKAYAELERREICYSVPGTGRFIAQNASEKLRMGSARALSELEEAAARAAMLGISAEEAREAVRQGFERSGMK